MSPDENYPNITKLVDDTMDLEEKSEAPATHSNSGIVFIIPDSSKKSNAFYQKIDPYYITRKESGRSIMIMT